MQVANQWCLLSAVTLSGWISINLFYEGYDIKQEIINISFSSSN